MTLKKSPYQLVDTTAVTMHVHEDTVTSKTLQVDITNQTANELVYGVGYELEVYEQGAWYTIDEGPIAVILLALMLPPYATTTEDIDWLHAYGSLAPGTYRLVKLIGPHRVAAVFIIV